MTCNRCIVLLAGALAALSLALAAPAAEAETGDADDAALIDPKEASIGQWVNIKTREESQWKGDLELGYLNTGGNEDNLSFQTRARVQNERRRFRHTGRMDVIVSEENRQTTQEQYEVTQKSAFKFFPKHYLFELLRFDRNTFSGYRYRWSEVIGYGYRAVATKEVTLDLELGPGARQTRPVAGDWPDEAIFLLAGDLSWDVSTISKFNQYLYYEWGERDAYTKSVTSLALKLAQSFSMKTSFTVTHHSEPLLDVRKTDTTSSVTIVYSF